MIANKPIGGGIVMSGSFQDGGLLLEFWRANEFIGTFRSGVVLFAEGTPKATREMVKSAIERAKTAA